MIKSAPKWLANWFWLDFLEHRNRRKVMVVEQTFFSIFHENLKGFMIQLRIDPIAHSFRKTFCWFNRPGIGNWMAKHPKELRTFSLDDVTWKGRGTATFSFEKVALLNPTNATNAWRASEQGRKVVYNVWVLSMMSRITQQKCFTFLCFNRTECFKRLLFPRFEGLKSSWQPGLLLHWL